MTSFVDLLGVTLSEVSEVSDDEGGDIIRFRADDGREWVQAHGQDCCEYVRVEEIVGDLDDLCGSPILLAEEVIYDNEPTPDGLVGNPEDYCWTFYKLATIKGHVTIRWLGESNGYYSTSVDFYTAPCQP